MIARLHEKVAGFRSIGSCRDKSFSTPFFAPTDHSLLSFNTAEKKIKLLLVATVQKRTEMGLRIFHLKYAGHTRELGSEQIFFNLFVAELIRRAGNNTII